jgi:hypothetical protein
MIGEFWNVMLLIFTVTGALCWLSMIVLIWFYWMCKRPPEKE